MLTTKIMMLMMLMIALDVAPASAERLRDPTTPLNYREYRTAAPALKLQAVIIGKGRREAIINNRIIAVGDDIAGRKVVEIREREVELTGAKILTLRPSIFQP